MSDERGSPRSGQHPRSRPARGIEAEAIDLRIDGQIKKELRAVIEAAYRASADVGRQVESALRAGIDAPLSRADAARLLTKIVSRLQSDAKKRGDIVAMRSLHHGVEQVVGRALLARDRIQIDAGMGKTTLLRPVLELHKRNGIEPGPVLPTPIFHGREIPMVSGFVKTTDIQLWEENQRLEIHLAQFHEQFEKNPCPDELVSIMLSDINLAGIPEKQQRDQFEIRKLARSIATNGVRRPPILARDGRLLDGNRRIAASYLILNSDEFDVDEKKRVEYTYVWQLTDHATTDQEEAVVVGLNFEDDNKEPWPEYVKARRIYEEWQALLAAEPRMPNASRQAQLRRELSKKFALGPDAYMVNRYIKMVQWAQEFEDHHINKRERTVHEARHRASAYFQFFDELSKGERNGVAAVIAADDDLKAIVFDLLFGEKFTEWKQIRDLVHVAENEEARKELRRARDADDREEGRERVRDALAMVRSRRAEVRSIGANTRIETFVKWLRDCPVSTFRDEIMKENLELLLDALKLVEGHVRAQLATHKVGKR